MPRFAPRTLERVALASVALALAVPAVLAAVFLTTPVARQEVAVAKRTVIKPVAAPRSEPAPEVVATQPARVTDVLPRPAAFDYGAWLWDAGGTTAGRIVITVDLRTQLLRVFRAGREIGVSTILYGAPDSPTPLGTFPITQKSRDHVSNIFYTPMPYALRLTNDGVMVHASNVRSGWASNGCVGIPKDFARQLFDVVKLGDRVVITDGEPLLRVGDALPVV